jgi:predicted CXXCH cytochrome family protein
MNVSSHWKKIITRVFVVAGLLVSGTAFAQIGGTAHDFSDDAWNPGGEICVVCHTPHNAISEAAANAGVGELGPLWNRALTTATFATYDTTNRVGSDIQSTLSGTPSGVSKLCLSCHDGSIAIDSFGGATGTNTIDDIRASANIGETVTGTGDLSNDHPVMFTFPASEPELVGKTGNVVNGASVPLPLFGTEQMECATCHDVHGTGNNYLLRVANTGSALCLNCHEK